MKIGALYRSHRTFGYLLATAQSKDGKEFAILQTSDHTEAASPSGMLLPVNQKEVAFEARMALLAAIERARFLGLSNETIQNLVTEELSAPTPT